MASLTLKATAEELASPRAKKVSFCAVGFLKPDTSRRNAVYGQSC